MPVLVDTHAHLADPSLLPAVSDVVVAAVDAGVDRILAVGVDLPSSAESVKLAEQFEPVWAAVGVHPHEAVRFDSGAREELRVLASNSKVVAIGEIGLDYYRIHAPPEIQRAAFHDQLDLAASLDLPVVVHNREADADVLRLIGEVVRGSNLENRAGVLHCFAGDEILAQAAIRLGFFISFAGNLTYRNAEALRQVATAVRGDRLLTETDSPYLTPVPFRGKPNRPANVLFVVKELARIKGASEETVAAEVFDNANRLFRWG